MNTTEIVKFKYYSRMHHKRIFLHEDYDYEVISILQDNANPENLIWRESYIRDEIQITKEILVPEYEGENEEEIQIMFDQFSIDVLAPIFNEERSVNRIKTSIYEFFKLYFLSCRPNS